MERLLQFHVSLMDVSKPRVWRDIVLPATMTFDDLHYVIQYAMGWDDVHLYQFQDKKHMYDDLEFGIRIPSDNDDDDYEVIDARTKKLNTYFNKVDKSMYYVYDYGDYWLHNITLKKIFNGGEGVWCIAGEGACPPEDVGGTSGYKEMKRLFDEEPDDEETISYRTWLGLEAEEDWDEHEFSRRAAQRCLNLWYRATKIRYFD